MTEQKSMEEAAATLGNRLFEMGFSERITGIGFTPGKNTIKVLSPEKWENPPITEHEGYVVEYGIMKPITPIQDKI